MSDPLPGPDRENLRNLAGMLPSFIKWVKKRKREGYKGKPVSTVRRPRKVCPICGLLWDHIEVKPTDDTMLKGDNCGPCSKLLDEGYTAFVCGENYAFGRNPTLLPDMAGKIIQISPIVFEKLAKQFDAKRKCPGADSPPDPQRN